MPKDSPDVPPLKRHKGTGQGYVLIDGKRRYLGRHGSPECTEKYEGAIVEWLGRRRGTMAPKVADLTIIELSARFLAHAETYYRDPDTGKPGTEFHHYPIALKPVIAAYGRTPAAAFGPLRFQAIREAYVGKGWSRKHINSQADRIRRMFRWGVTVEIVPSSVYEALRAVPGLKRGRTDAPDNPPVRPVSLSDVEATKPHLSTPLRLAVELQLLTAARPGEILSMRPMDVDRTDKAVWVYAPARHKTAGHGHERKIYLGPKAQTLLAPYLLNREPGDFIVSPRDAVAELFEKRREARKTPPGQGNEPGTNRKAKPMRQAGERYDTDGYRRAIERACELAFPVPDELVKDAVKVAEWRRSHRWHPHRLRHSAGTMLRKEYGLEVASILMGHRDVGISKTYAERDESKAREVARKIG